MRYPEGIPGLWFRLGSKTKKEILEEGNSKLFHLSRKPNGYYAYSTQESSLIQRRPIFHDI